MESSGIAAGYAGEAPSAQLAASRPDGKWGLSGSVYARIVQVLVYAAAVLVPLVFLPVTSGVLEYNKQMLLVAIAAIGLVVWLLGIVVSGRLSWRSTPIDKGVLGLAVAAVVATVFSMTQGKSLFGMPVSLSSSLLTVLVLTIYYFLATNALQDRGRTLRAALGLSLFVTLIVGISQMFTWYFLPGNFTHSRAFNTVGSLNALGILAAVALPLFAKSIAGSSTFRRILALLGVVVSVLALAILNWWVLWAVALAGMLAMIAFDSLNATRLAEDYGGRGGRFALSRFVVPMVVIVLGAFLLLVDFNPASVKGQFPVEVAPSHRLSWDIARGVLGVRLLTGWGPENFSLAFDRFGAGALSDTQLSGLRFFDATSEIGSIAVHTGVVGLLALALLFWCIIQASARFGGAIAESAARGDGALFANEATGTFAALMAMAVALFLYPFNIVLWFVFVTLLALAALVISGDRQRTVDIEEKPIFSLAASLGFIVGLILVLCAVYFSSVRYLSDVRCARALAAATPREAMDGLARAIDLNPSDDRILRDASQVALALVREEVAKGSEADGSLVQNLMASAIQLAQRAAQIQPDEALNWNNLGTVYQSLTGLVEDVERLAEDAFTKAAELRPGDPAFDNRAGAMWLARADLIRSLATSQNAAALQPQYEESLAKAEAAFNRALEKSPSFGLAIYNRAAVRDRQNKVADAIADLETIAPANANEPTLMFELGLLYARANRLDDAMAAMRRAVLLAPQYANARWYLALLLEERGDTAAALEQLREIERNNADNEVLKQKIQQLTAVPPVVSDEEAVEVPPLQ